MKVFTTSTSALSNAMLDKDIYCNAAPMVMSDNVALSSKFYFESSKPADIFDYSNDVEIEGKWYNSKHNGATNAMWYNLSVSGMNGQQNRKRSENPFRFSGDVLANLSANYSHAFSETAQMELEKALDPENTKTKKTKDGRSETAEGSGVERYTFDVVASPSLFNPYFAVHIAGMTENVPLLMDDTERNGTVGTHLFGFESSDKKGKDAKGTVTSDSFNVHFTRHIEDTSDCSIKRLVELSGASQGKDRNEYINNSLTLLGGAGYRYTDFMFCKDLGKISNNHLITVRRFTHPVTDNIYNQVLTDGDLGDNGDKRGVVPDIARMVTWFNENNKMEDILKYNFQMTFKELNSKIQEKQSEEDSSERGIMGSVVNLMNPSYRAAVGRGTAGSGNLGLGFLQGVSGKMPWGTNTLTAKGQYENHPALGNYDNNRVYEPPNTLRSTHIYEGNLKFEQSFTLVFEYELRAYQNINPRSAFEELIANVLACTYKHGRFWGGQQKVVGAPGNRAGWKKAQDFVDQAWDKLGGFMDSLMSGDVDWGSIWGSVSNMLGAAADTAKNMLNGGGKGAKEAVQKTYKTLKDNGAGKVLKGMLQNSLGRPAMYAFDSLLTGDPVGFWHITLGNPLKPIMVMGNMILEKTEIQQYGPLGLDDFPTNLKVTCTFKHGRPRDITDIEMMYTKGKEVIYTPLNTKKLDNYYNVTVEDKEVKTTKYEAGKVQTKKDENGQETKSQEYTEKETTVTVLTGSLKGGVSGGATKTFGTTDVNQIIYNFAHV